MDDSDSINMTNLTSQILQSPITRPAQRQSLQQIQPDNNNPRLSPVKSTDPTPRKSVNVIISSEDFTNLSTPIHALITTPTSTNSNNKFSSNNSSHRNSNTKLPMTSGGGGGITRTESGRLLPQIGQSKIPIFNTSNTVFIYIIMYCI